MKADFAVNGQMDITDEQLTYLDQLLDVDSKNLYYDKQVNGANTGSNFSLPALPPPCCFPGGKRDRHAVPIIKIPAIPQKQLNIPDL